VDEEIMQRSLLAHWRKKITTCISEQPLTPVPVATGSLATVNQMHPLVLAYVGDAIYELYVRTYLLQRETKVRNLHKMATELVKASTQAAILKGLEADLTEDEKAAARRGRNAKGHTPKNAAMIDYRHATAFEALLGYLFLTEQDERLLEVLHRSVEEGRRCVQILSSPLP
jgi:ribonuclease III family protein